MDLRNTKAYMRGQRLSVDGRIYQLDGDGIVRGVLDVDARTLLQGKDWLVVGGSLPAAPKPAARPPKPTSPASPASVGKPPVGAPSPAAPVFQSAAQPPAVAPTPQPVDEPFPEEVVAPVVEQPATPPLTAPPASEPVLEVPPAQSDAQPAAVADKEPEWPEPSEEMTAHYLREMADAFHVEIPYGVRKKSELVSLIRAAREAEDAQT